MTLNIGLAPNSRTSHNKALLCRLCGVRLFGVSFVASETEKQCTNYFMRQDHLRLNLKKSNIRTFQIERMK